MKQIALASKDKARVERRAQEQRAYAELRERSLPLATALIEVLPKRIKKAAESGERMFTLFQNSYGPLTPEEVCASNILRTWANANGFLIQISEFKYGGSDDYSGSQSAYIYW
jgi:hypothetical protein